MGFKGKVHVVQVKFIRSLKSLKESLMVWNPRTPRCVISTTGGLSVKKQNKWRNSRGIMGVAAFAVKQPTLLTIYPSDQVAAMSIDEVLYLSFIHVRWIPIQIK